MGEKIKGYQHLQRIVFNNCFVNKLVFAFYHLKSNALQKIWWKKGEVTRIMYNEILQFHSSFWIVSFLGIDYF
jgi:hypothetical protein